MCSKLLKMSHPSKRVFFSPPKKRRHRELVLTTLSKGRTPLFTAALSGHLEVMKLLLRVRANTEAAERSQGVGLVGLRLYRLLSQSEACWVNVFFSGRDPQFEHGIYLFVCVFNLFALEASLDKQIKYDSALELYVFACLRGLVASTIAMMGILCGVMDDNSFKQSYITWAFNGHAFHARFCYKLFRRTSHRAPLRITDRSGALQTAKSKGWTPLVIAAANCHWEAMQLLLEARANVEAADKSGQEPRKAQVSSVWVWISYAIIDE